MSPGGAKTAGPAGQRHSLLLLLALLVCACRPYVAKRLDPLPVTPPGPGHRSLRVRILAALLAAQEAGQTLSGQNIGHGENYDATLMSVGPYTPAILGFGLGYGDYSSTETTRVLDLLEQHFRAGGLVSISLHPANPRTGRDAHDKRFSEYAELLDPDSSVGKNWQTIVHNAANFLQRLKDRGIIVLFRPLHEANGGWFWWGNDFHPPQAEEFKALFRQLHHTLVETRQLDNLLFVYAMAETYEEKQPRADSYFPGQEYVDVLGLDFYDHPARFDDRGDYSALAALARETGKPLCLAELGPSHGASRWQMEPCLELLNRHPVAYFLAWHSWPAHAIALRDAQGGTELLAEPAILNRGSFRY